MLTTFVGDVHGKYAPFKKLMEQFPNIIQVGDMGVGFRYLHPDGEIKFRSNPPYDTIIKQ